MDRDMWDAVIDTNLGFCNNLCKVTFQDMRERKFGRIVNIGSVKGQAGQYGHVTYAAAGHRRSSLKSRSVAGCESQHWDLLPPVLGKPCGRPIWTPNRS